MDRQGRDRERNIHIFSGSPPLDPGTTGFLNIQILSMMVGEGGKEETNFQKRTFLAREVVAFVVAALV